jgi:hypothetical protein
MVLKKEVRQKRDFLLAAVSGGATDSESEKEAVPVSKSETER